ncbi:hypothetical protein [Saccharothrix algeriensis]|uniref:Uncharacterized protein n=1 Tax=Saccharothrix algeriensis TaxID=173560 RepID=A0ABS2S8D3_9PSEU|nr:hypothetical protein [Saccharothrix algeriensis]MBM7812484.1 hypothetical protein [Saccharothrix algeriensis]
METLAHTLAHDAPIVYAVVDEEGAVAAWIIELRPDDVLTAFFDGSTTYTTDSTQCALEFVNLTEGINGQLINATAARHSTSEDPTAL